MIIVLDSVNAQHGDGLEHNTEDDTGEVVQPDTSDKGNVHSWNKNLNLYLFASFFSEHNLSLNLGFA